jgi:hypothetical protein
LNKLVAEVKLINILRGYSSFTPSVDSIKIVISN